MYPGTYAAQTPDRIAAVMAGTGDTVSYGELERRSVQLGHILHEVGLRPGDAVALLTENSLRALEVYWAALRSGLYITAVNYRLKPERGRLYRQRQRCRRADRVGRAGRDRDSGHGSHTSGEAVAGVRWRGPRL